MQIQLMFKTLPVVLLALLCSLSVQAQKNTEVKAKPLSQEAIEASDDLKESDYNKGLNLSAEQKASFKKANQEFKAKARSTKNAKKDEMQRLRQERIAAHKASLKPEQLKKYDEMLAQKEAKRKEKQAQKQAQRQEQKASKKAEKKGKE